MNAPLATAPSVDTHCKGCGDCCRANGLIPPLLAEDDVPEWLSTLVSNLRRHFAAIAEDYPCVFLTLDNRCAIHELKLLTVCKDFACASL